MPTTATTTTGASGILLTDEFLALKDLSLQAKVIYLLIRRDLESTGKHFTSSMTDPRLAKMTCLSAATIQRKLKELDKKGYIALVSLTKIHTRDEGGRATAYRGIRYIYLDKREAGYRRRVINKAKPVLDFMYQLLVLHHGMSPVAYVEWRKGERAKAAKERREEELREEATRLEDAYTEFLAGLTDEEVTELEKLNEVAPGTYVTRKREFLERAARIKASADEWTADLPAEDSEGKPGV